MDCLTNDNFTALHLAVEAGKAVVVESLLGNGATVHIKVGVIMTNFPGSRHYTGCAGFTMLSYYRVAKKAKLLYTLPHELMKSEERNAHECY